MEMIRFLFGYFQSPKLVRGLDALSHRRRKNF
jgi:hypothetical protein